LFEVVEEVEDVKEEDFEGEAAEPFLNGLFFVGTEAVSGSNENPLVNIELFSSEEADAENRLEEELGFGSEDGSKENENGTGDEIGGSFVGMEEDEETVGASSTLGLTSSTASNFRFYYQVDIRV
jgi:hypothetical protein